ncbi:MAG: bifunctional riboflavin kinase/FAD synthetase [Mangrovibacterium sp.]
MQIYHQITDFKLEKAVLTIGSFDGVHLGHLKVIETLKQIAKLRGGETVIYTFFPHPQQVLYPQESRKSLRMLTSLDERIALFEKAGVDHLIIFPFSKEFAQMSHYDFVKLILVEQLHVDSLILGYDHRFGKDAAGNFDTVFELSQEFNFNLVKLDALCVDNNNISSTEIRNALAHGNVVLAQRYLGYHYALSGEVVKGKQLGRTIQFPTANIKLHDDLKLIPKDGVYVVQVQLGDCEFGGMMNIGSRPTVNSDVYDKTIEVHLFDFDGEIYGQSIRVAFVDRLRDEMRFASVNDLQQQLISDKLQALTRLQDFDF